VIKEKENIKKGGNKDNTKWEKEEKKKEKRTKRKIPEVGLGALLLFSTSEGFV